MAMQKFIKGEVLTAQKLNTMVEEIEGKADKTELQTLQDKFENQYSTIIMGNWE